MKFMKALCAVVMAGLLFNSQAFASATPVLDQIPAPLNAIDQSEVYTQSQPVSGGTLYTTILRQTGPQGLPIAISNSFVPTSVTGSIRNFALTSGKADTGVALTATATGGAVGVARTAGTSLALVGEATSSSAETDKVMFEIDLPDSYVAGSNIPLYVYASVTGSGTLTGASTTITPAFYTESNGVETAGTISAAQQIVAAGSTLTFTITGTGLVPGERVVVELTMLVTTASGANTGSIGKVAITA